jgi:hypothetical protein
LPFAKLRRLENFARGRLLQVFLGDFPTMVGPQRLATDSVALDREGNPKPRRLQANVKPAGAGKEPNGCRSSASAQPVPQIRSSNRDGLSSIRNGERSQGLSVGAGPVFKSAWNARTPLGRQPAKRKRGWPHQEASRLGAPGKGRTPHKFAQAEEVICKKCFFDTQLFHQDQVSANTTEIAIVTESSERKLSVQ